MNELTTLQQKLAENEPVGLKLGSFALLIPCVSLSYTERVITVFIKVIYD